MRYTHKLKKPEGNCNYFLIPDKEQCDAAENKLGQFEDIEDEYCIIDEKDLRERLDLADRYIGLSGQLGIDLSTLFKALENGIYAKLGNDVIYIHNPVLNLENRTIGYLYMYGLKDYGKTWALTKEELL